ncbi:MAG: tyrosine-type recombinase/integrase [bacterium]
MARTKKKRWSYSAGERGRNRVRAFEHSSGMLMLEFYEGGTRNRISLGHRDREQAKRKAEAAAAKLIEAESLRPEPPKKLTFGKLFEMYLGEVTPRNSERHQRYDRTASKMFLRFFGAERNPSTLSLRDWDRFIRDRKAGRLGPGKGPWRSVANRTVQKDLSFLRSVLRWATMAGDGLGGVLLERDPLRGYPLPREKNPRRPSLTKEEYHALLEIAYHIDWRFHVVLVLAHETGHRIGAVGQLLWSDVDVENRLLRWRDATDKNGRTHHTPMTDEALEALEEARRRSPGIGDTPVLPSPKDGSRPVSRYLVREWCRKAERLAGSWRISSR